MHVRLRTYTQRLRNRCSFHTLYCAYFLGAYVTQHNHLLIFGTAFVTCGLFCTYCA